MPKEPSGKEKLRTVREWLEALKKLYGLDTPAAVARELGLTRRAVFLWEIGENRPGLRESMKIGIKLGVNPLLIVLASERERLIAEGKDTRAVELLAKPLAPWEPKSVTGKG